jgi:hypothetical protein
MSHRTFRSWPLLVVGIAIGFAFARLGHDSVHAFAADAAPTKSPDLQSVAADVAVLKGKAPDQSHAMMDVAFQFTNCWFAGEKQNWPLADFFASETKSHLEWAVRIIPVRKDNAGRDVELAKILGSLENSPLKELAAAIKGHDKPGFEKAYRFTLEGCYACHKAVNKPYIHPQVPTAPPLTIINFDPNADWPK